MIKTKTIEEMVTEKTVVPLHYCNCDECHDDMEMIRKKDAIALVKSHEKQVLEEEIEELEGMKKSVLENVLIGRNDELFEKHGVDGVKGHNQAIEDLITLKQQQIQEAKELLDNK